MKRFEGKVAIVTGAASGIGKATALRFGADGAKVLAADRDAAGAEATAKAIVEAGGTAASRRTDVTVPADAKATVGDAIERFGRLDFLANVAGVGFFRRATETTDDDWNRMIGVNLTGPFLMAREALPHVVAATGAIVNTASVAGLHSHPYSAAYCASKGGVVLLTKALAVEFARKGVRVNCVCPGGIDTPLIAEFQLPEGVNPAVLARIVPYGRYGTPDEVAATIAFLCSDEAKYINGAALTVDGGLSA